MIRNARGIETVNAICIKNIATIVNNVFLYTKNSMVLNGVFITKILNITGI